MNNESWVKNLQKLTDITNLATEKQIGFYQNILVAGASILGILISLQSTQTSCLYIRLVFLLPVYLLLSGVLLAAIVLHDLSSLPGQVQKAFAEELRKVLHKDINPNPISVPKKKRTIRCEKWCLISLPASLFSLVIYTALCLTIY